MEQAALQILGRFVFFEDIRQDLVLEDLPLVRIPVKLRYIDGQVADELIIKLVICPDLVYKRSIGVHLVALDKSIDAAPHLLFLVGVKIYLGKLKDLFLKLLIAVSNQYEYLPLFR